MQKILSRVATAERVVAKRQKTKDMKYRRKEKNDMLTQSRFQVRGALDEVREAKQAIRDDWTMGPLAPRKDVGEWDSARGAIGDSRYSSPGFISLAARNARCQWAGGAYYLNLAVGDRVVLLDGPDKGRISKISSINQETAEVTIKDLNKSNVRIASYLRNSPDDPMAVSIELPLPISAVRLVHPVALPSSGGQTRDVIINQLVHKDLITDRITGKRRWQRVVPGLNISIPWPEKEEPEPVDHKADTLRINVDEKTFIPTLLRPPMPENVIDELRGKYSRFRTRHEPEYVARLEAEEQAKKDRVNLMDSMRTPLQEFHRAERANKKRKGKPRLTLEMLEKIGEVIARNRERSLNAAGLSDVPPSSSEASGDAPPPDVSSDAEASPTPSEVAPSEVAQPDVAQPEAEVIPPQSDSEVSPPQPPV
ncbi:KOW domain-containing protein [Xylaria sp. CBS 124048]|nr:KOW domain-containing protein [Xylaria sp. CBS 124048]